MAKHIDIYANVNGDGDIKELQFQLFHLGKLLVFFVIDSPTAFNADKTNEVWQTRVSQIDKYYNEFRANQYTASRTPITSYISPENHILKIIVEIKYRKKLPRVTFAIVDYSHSNNANKCRNVNVLPCEKCMLSETNLGIVCVCVRVLGRKR